MRIVIVSPFYHPSIGGVESIVRQTAEELARRKYEVSVITTNYSNAWVKLSEPDVKAENGVEIYRLRPKPVKMGYAALMDGLKETITKVEPDIVHSHNLHPHLFQAMSWKNRGKFKLVAQLHCPQASGIDNMAANLIYPITMWLLRYQRKIDAFVAHTNLERTWLINNGIDEMKIHRLNYPCVSSSFLRKWRNDHAESKNTPRLGEEQRLLYVGRITRRKGIHILLQALPSVISDFKDTITLVAGPTDQKYYGILLAVAKNLNLGRNLVFSQALSEESKYRAMLNCKIFVNPSIKDYTPVTLIEAQALGKPVVSTVTGAIPEIVKNGETGLLVEPQNPIALANAIKWLLSREEDRRAMGKKAEQWVRQNFLLDNVVDQLEKLYAECMNDT